MGKLVGEVIAGGEEDKAPSGLEEQVRKPRREIKSGAEDRQELGRVRRIGGSKRRPGGRSPRGT